MVGWSMVGCPVLGIHSWLGALWLGILMAGCPVVGYEFAHGWVPCGWVFAHGWVPYGWV